MPELLLPRLKREIEARLDELRPIVAEAERLIAAKQALLAEAAAESRRAARTSQRNGAAPPHANGALATAERAAATNGAGHEQANGRTARGANQTAILAIVDERPGVSVAEIAAVTKIAKPTVATTVSKLKREGVLADEAGGVKLASRQPLTLSQAAAPRDGGVSDEEWEAARRKPAAA